MEVDGLHVLAVPYPAQYASAIEEARRQAAADSTPSKKKKKNGKSTPRKASEKQGIVPKHYFYYKKHVLKHHTAEQPEGRTLFVLNLPLQPEETLEHVFSSFGEVESVTIATLTLGSKKKGTAVSTEAAHVVFADEAALEKSLEVDTTKHTITMPTFPKEAFGLEKYHQQYRDATVTDYDGLQEEINAVVNAFEDERERKRTQLLASRQTDEDGWTLVTSGNVDAIPEEELESREREKKMRTRRKKKKTELVNFYKFQKLEAQKQELALKRKKFDEDKHRMSLLKNSRKFRPY